MFLCLIECMVRHTELGTVIAIPNQYVSIDVSDEVPLRLQSNWSKFQDELYAKNGTIGTIDQAIYNNFDGAWIVTIITKEDKIPITIPAYWLRAFDNYRFTGGNTFIHDLIATNISNKTKNIGSKSKIGQHDGLINEYFGSDGDESVSMNFDEAIDENTNCVVSKIMEWDATMCNNGDCNDTEIIGQGDGHIGSNSDSDSFGVAFEEENVESGDEDEHVVVFRNLKTDSLLVDAVLVEPIKLLMKLVQDGLEQNKEEIIVKVDEIKQLCVTQSINLITIDESLKEVIDGLSKIQQNYNGEGINETVNE